MEDVLREIASNLYDGEDKVVADLVRKALDNGLDPRRSCSLA